VIVDDLDVLWTALHPAKANPVSIVDSDTVLSLPVPFQPLEAVRRWNSQISEPVRLVELVKLALGDFPELYRARPPANLRPDAVEHVLRALISERSNHRVV